MKIIIENNKFIYIYFQNELRLPIISKTEADAILLYDDNGNWIGLNIFHPKTSEKNNIIPSLDYIDYDLGYGIISKTDNDLHVFFDIQSTVQKEVKFKGVCYIDVSNKGLFGIEIILYDKEIGGKDVIKEFIAQNTVHPNATKLEFKEKNAENTESVPLQDLIANALRMTPDRIVVDKCNFSKDFEAWS
ncbi:hypothetical protein [Alkaliphilus sp. B6464]|uniref:hypothetical protein n=1 Tax=Alkaliphilus sp. B6464 TaxID=2731219 RepID=UPI001BA71DBA|nr:hypothetical protein [Alkaliphilus sp. B6464]QUH22182.1 hypothetical protein HYG84_19945 [Alkaliphilus sp. B6464]